VKALLQPNCRSIAGLDLAYNCLSPDAPLLLAPLLHDPPAPLPRSLSTFQQAYQPPTGHALLTHLVLTGNPIGDAGAEVVLKLVATGDCPLQLLDLSRCGITAKSSGALKPLLEGSRLVGS
jgi:hypothetical protein